MYNLKGFRSVSVLAVITFFVMMFQVKAFAQFESSAQSAILIEASTGQVLYEKNADVPMPPASITKIMTLLLGFEALEKGLVKWDDEVIISEKAWRMEGSKMFLLVGDKAKFGEIMTGISVVSANDGCVALAEHLYGSEEAFVQVMNTRAKELGLTNTNFANSNGLPAEGHVMSARDISTLARYLIQNYPKILELESTTEYTYNNIRQFNRNPLLGVFPGADGLKTGWTEEAGYCIVGTAQQNGQRMIGVVLKTSSEKERSKAIQELLNYGFKNFKQVTVKNAGEIVDSIEVKNGKKLSVSLKLDSDISTVIPVGRENDLQIVTSKKAEFLNAPVSLDIPAGTVEVQLDGKTIATSTMSTAEEAERLGFFAMILRNIANFFKSLF
ncbi:MAG TPA: D-alanyl-D-alanine carboxypeptidase [Hungateiclostridium thermocellum]|jgi:D-alanyl-D-alanine carboxypeptidase (penicillin-binding protein 5/6)|uniref:serine-type D-Ala-D-Ala carboxypeptidase n=2 Tax=Acetivibrio thermocellus TaxID=1515 RepID=A3DC32_ACET2|nr:D-alanyl-D-alanine carboxypeptidase family protein [Acetivibrio thermocellus]CDG34949.1 penicillin-binding protein 6 [Acetivibrio thermocellus BC1]ABN51511.1 Serine-type D-Ala-D-Ala carboxypeptidase [Acetivibrio thermocellus ATCC 27405]ADU75004.1 Serine-type D-Ala-D-Ala carboxypeptidase [Acetivibrio thermocellus DSM 1313]ALX08972.1 Serine-type D-Ala-D-Ala carboxypeptidase [Acetivibrio thermocellus AD2]ANV76722.1 Serine-type D-Ala-D-Ala carboxypeptidase [Acetivibrio thermocellus DSM 2360]